jgi:hypothetical protein
VVVVGTELGSTSRVVVGVRILGSLVRQEHHNQIRVKGRERVGRLQLNDSRAGNRNNLSNNSNNLDQDRTATRPGLYKHNLNHMHRHHVLSKLSRLAKFRTLRITRKHHTSLKISSPVNKPRISLCPSRSRSSSISITWTTLIPTPCETSGT